LCGIRVQQRKCQAFAVPRAHTVGTHHPAGGVQNTCRALGIEALDRDGIYAEVGWKNPGSHAALTVQRFGDQDVAIDAPGHCLSHGGVIQWRMCEIELDGVHDAGRNRCDRESITLDQALHDVWWHPIDQIGFARLQCQHFGVRVLDFLDRDATDRRDAGPVIGEWLQGQVRIDIQLCCAIGTGQNGAIGSAWSCGLMNDEVG
jgi:hypothetical protein